MSATPRIPPARTVAVGRPVDWLTAGWRLFAANPGVWVAQTLILIVLLFLLGLVPLLGWALVLVAFPILTAGFLAGAERQQQGGVVTVDLLFEGLRRHAANLCLVGLFYLLGGLAAGFIAALVGSAGFSGFLLGAGAGLGLTMGSMLLASLVFTLLWALLMMGMSFAPALVLFTGAAPLDAIKASLSACLHNLGAVLLMAVIVYILGWMAMLPAGLGTLILVPVLAGSLYAAYRDIFGTAEEAPALPPPSAD